MRMYFNLYDTGGYSKKVRGLFKVETPLAMLNKGARNFHYIFGSDKWSPELFYKALNDPYSLLLSIRKTPPNHISSNSKAGKIVREIADGFCQLTRKKVAYKNNGNALLQAAHIIPFGAIKELGRKYIIDLYDSCLFRVAMDLEVHGRFDNDFSFKKKNIRKVFAIGESNYTIAIKEYGITPLSEEQLEMARTMKTFYINLVEESVR